MYEIRRLTEPDLPDSLAVIRSAFNTVAAEMNLTPEHCPGHTAFTNIEKLLGLYWKAAFFGLYTGAEQAGFVAMEKASDGEIFYLDKLAVLPRWQHNGYGSSLVKHGLDYARGQGAKAVSLGMIDSHTVLKNWYSSLGFRETGTNKFEHLPFTVCFMDFDLSAQKIE
ncbi:MAG: GNAT family N-acetyltransferase [Dehalococcoidia bacterium]|nr:GNAT family N-acetyltransferase [Dehalococcoidia bacterium]